MKYLHYKSNNTRKLIYFMFTYIKITSMAPIRYQTCSIKNIYLIIMKSTLKNENFVINNFIY